MRVSCEKLMLCKYLALFLFMFFLQLQQVQHLQTWLWKRLGKNGYQIYRVWNVRKGEQIYGILLQTLYGMHSGCSSVSLRTTPTTLKPARNGWVGHSPPWSPQRSQSVASIPIWNYFIHTLLKNVRISQPKLLLRYLTFLEICGKGGGGWWTVTLQPVWTSCPWCYYYWLILECERDNTLANSLVYGAYSGGNMCKMGLL